MAPLRESPITETRLACPDCGLIQRLPRLTGAQVAECRRCARTLVTPARGRRVTPLALALAAFILLLPALVAPQLRVYAYGLHESGMTSAAGALWAEGYPVLGSIVAVCSIFIPCAFLALLIFVLASLAAGPSHGLGSAFRWVKHLRPWVMIEVYLLGAFVAYSRIRTVAVVEIGAGGWCLLGATLMMLFALTQLDERTVWERLPIAARGEAGRLRIACTVCDLVVEDTAEGRACPRCGARLRLRRPHALARTTALLAAGYLLYVPANVLPVLRIGYFGGQERNTLLSGVLELARTGLWPLAIIVLLASILIPLVKMWGLTWMLIATRRRSGVLLRSRTRLYRLIELAGRWSNIDVFMAGVLVSLLQAGTLTQVHAQNGLVAFAAVVILTMLATTSFDPRLMWDAAGRTDGRAARRPAR